MDRVYEEKACHHSDVLTFCSPSPSSVGSPQHRPSWECGFAQMTPLPFNLHSNEMLSLGLHNLGHFIAWRTTCIYVYFYLHTLYSSSITFSTNGPGEWTLSEQHRAALGSVVLHRGSDACPHSRWLYQNLWGWEEASVFFKAPKRIPIYSET